MANTQHTEDAVLDEIFGPKLKQQHREDGAPAIWNASEAEFQELAARVRAAHVELVA